MKDAEFFDARLSKIEGAGELGQRIIDIVREKAISPPVVNGAEAD